MSEAVIDLEQDTAVTWSYGQFRAQYGSTLDPEKEYPLLDLLDEFRAPAGGGMAKVSFLKDLYTPGEPRYALKQIISGLASDSDIQKRFASEIQTHLSLNHPNIVPARGYGSYNDKPALVLEYMDAPTLSLAAAAEGRPLTAARAGADIARALSYLHGQSILHRDIKPDNIFVGQPDKAGVLADFGLACSLGSEEEDGVTIGTPYYMSPEQCRGTGVDTRSDLYNLGATLYHAATGRPPFDGDSAVDIVYNRLKGGSPVHPGQFGVSLCLSETIMKAMKNDPDRRYQTAEDMEADLHTIAEDLRRPSRMFFGPAKTFVNWCRPYLHSA